MKKLSFVLGKPFMALLAVALAFGFAVSAMFVSCDDGGQTSSNPFKGTWTSTFRNQGDYLNGQTVTMVVEDTTYSYVTSGGFEQRGTYTYTGNTANGLATHQRNNSSSSWEAYSPPISFTMTVSGNTITGNGETFTRVR